MKCLISQWLLSQLSSKTAVSSHGVAPDAEETIDFQLSRSPFKSIIDMLCGLYAYNDREQGSPWHLCK